MVVKLSRSISMHVCDEMSVCSSSSYAVCNAHFLTSHRRITAQAVKGMSTRIQGALIDQLEPGPSS